MTSALLIRHSSLVFLVRDAGASIGKKLDQLGSADYRRTRDQIVFVQVAALEAGRADINLSARFGEVVHQILERSEAFFTNVVRVSLLAEADALGTQKDHRFLIRADG